MSEATELIKGINEVISGVGAYGIPLRSEGFPRQHRRIVSLINKALQQAYGDGQAFGEHVANGQPMIDDLKQRLDRSEVDAVACLRQAEHATNVLRAREADVAALKEKNRVVSDHRARAEQVAAAVTERLRQFLTETATKLGVKAINAGGDSFLLCDQLDKLMTAISPREPGDETVELMNQLTAARHEIAQHERSLQAAGETIAMLQKQAAELLRATPQSNTAPDWLVDAANQPLTLAGVTFEADGEVEQNSCGMWTAGINLEGNGVFGRDSTFHGHAMQFHAMTRELATIRRDLVLRGLHAYVAVLNGLPVATPQPDPANYPNIPESDVVLVDFLATAVRKQDDAVVRLRQEIIDRLADRKEVAELMEPELVRVTADLADWRNVGTVVLENDTATAAYSLALTMMQKLLGDTQ